MEVHHHPSIEKKNFKEYFLEFLMIFLAVTMGFFAESIREHITDGEHAKQLCLQLVQDLTNDTSALNQIEAEESVILAQTDTLSRILQQPISQADFRRIQELTVKCYSYYPFYPSLGAINAIKNELRLKQFSNSEIASYITRYERRTGVMLKIQDLKSDLLRSYIEPFFRLHFKADNLDAALGHHPVLNGELRNLSQNEMEQLSVDLVLIKNINKDMIAYNRLLKDQALELTQYLIKQFHLENA